METAAAPERLSGRYVLEERIASGGMAAVWRARDEVLARPVAVKILHAELARDPDFLRRFQQEAIAAARLTHPRIVRVFDTGTEDGTAFIVMELFEGESLADVLARGPIDPVRAASIAVGLLEGLAHAHEHGVVHRDVKPGNVLVAPDGLVKVTDFGIAKAAFAGQDLTTTGKVLGTVRYLSPEQVRGEPVDARSDLYAAGVLLYEAVTGRPPFEAETDLAAATIRLTRDPLPPRAIRAGIPRELDRVVMRALARAPEDRYPSAEDMRADLVSAMGTPPAAAPAPRTRPVEPRRADRHRQPSFFRSWMLVPLVALLLAAAGVVAGLVLGRLEIGGPLGVRPADGDAGGGDAAPVAIENVTDHDPAGDGSENPEAASLAADGDGTTHWETERYDSAPLGGLKPGVGLVLDLGTPAQVTGVQVTSPLPGWTFEVRAGGDPGGLAEAEPRGGPSGTSFTAVEGRTDVRLEPFNARYLLLWVTGLAPAEGGYRARIAEVRVLGSGG